VTQPHVLDTVRDQFEQEVRLPRRLLDQHVLAVVGFYVESAGGKLSPECFANVSGDGVLAAPTGLAARIALVQTTTTPATKWGSLHSMCSIVCLLAPEVVDPPGR
jgi:hypothetical protein